MTDKRIFNMFKYHFPHCCTDIEMWKPNGKNSILIRKKRGVEFVFTYNDKDDWCFETAKSFGKGALVE